MTNNGKIALLDGYAHIYRGFYAIRNLTNPRGEPINALYAIARLLLKLDHDLPHEYGAMVMDKGKPAKRLQLLPEYKATRPPMPPALRQQLPLIRDWVEAAGWSIIEEEGREADDLIAAVVEARQGCRTYIVTHDKDLAQLVSPDVVLIMPGKQTGAATLDAVGVRQKFGVAPDQIVDYLALLGDAADNIPGIAGVGPKTAVSLLNRFGNIDNILADADTIESVQMRGRIQESADLLRRNRELVALDRTLPHSWVGLNGIRRRLPDWTRLIGMAREHGFRSLLTSLEKARSEAQEPRLF